MMNTSFPPRIWPRFVVVAIVLLAGLIVVKWHENLPLSVEFRNLTLPYRVTIDSESYLLIATGRLSEVQSPFSKRVLYPTLARGIAAVSDLSLAHAFLVLNFFSLGLLAYGVSACLECSLRHVGASPVSPHRV